MNEKRERNSYVDALRGVAMLLVILGHTMTGSTEGSQSSFLFQVVWSLQMPLFILISGYVTRYAKDIQTHKELFYYIKKRTIAYLFPWFVWTILIRGLLFGNRSFLNPNYIFWHMDSGYWFLFSIWTICIIFGVGQYVSNRVVKRQNKVIKLVLSFGVYVLGMVLLLLIGLGFGISFLGIKLTLYYMPFYFAGFLYGQIQDELFKSGKGRMLCDICVAASFAAWIAIITKVNLYDISDTGIGIIIRAIASLTGCIAICGLLYNVLSTSASMAANGSVWQNQIKRYLNWIGRNSLEIYILHGFFLNLMKWNYPVSFFSLQGVVLVFINWTVTVLCTSCFVRLLQGNRILSRCLFSK